MTTTSLDRTIDLRHYVKILWRRKGLVLLCVTSVFCAALVSLNFMPKEYESRVTIQLDETQALIRELEQVMGRGGSSRMSYDADRGRIISIMSRIRSQPFLEKVARILQMTSDASIRARAEQLQKDQPNISVDDIALRLVVQGLQSRIRFRSMSTDVYEVIVTDYDPVNAQRLAHWISQFFKDDTKRVANERVEAAKRFAEERLGVYQEELRRAEANLERHRGSQIGENLEPSAVRTENLATAEYLQRRLVQDANDAQLQREPFAREIRRYDLDPDAALSLQEDRQLQIIVDRLSSSLASAITDYLGGFGSDTGEAASSAGLSWPPRGQYLEMRQDLSDHLETRARASLSQADENLVGYLASYAFYEIDHRINMDAARSLDERIQRFKIQAQNRPVEEFELRRLEDEVARKREVLELWRRQEMGSVMRQAMENASLGTTVEILDPPQVPLAPSRPAPGKILLAAVLFGLVLGVGFAFLVQTMDTTLRTIDEIQRVAPEPILCTAPLLSKLQVRPRGLRRYWLPAALSGVIVLTVAFFVVRFTLLGDVEFVGHSIETTDPNILSAPQDPTPPGP